MYLSYLITVTFITPMISNRGCRNSEPNRSLFGNTSTINTIHDSSVFDLSAHKEAAETRD